MSKPPGVKVPVGIKDETRKGAQDVKRTLTSTFKDIAKIAAGFLARDLVRGLVATGRESLELASKAESLKRSFNALKVSTGNYQTTLDTMRQATSGAISEAELFAAANQYMSLRLPTGKLEEMWKAAIKVGRAMGMTATQSVRDFNVAVGRASPLILDNFGLTLKMAEAQEIYAGKLGKSVDLLSEAEKKMAFQEAAIIKLSERSEELGDATGDALTTFDQFNALLTDIKTTIGRALLPAVVAVMKGMNAWLTGISGLMDAINNLRSASSDLASAVNDVEAAQARYITAQSEARLRTSEYASALEATAIAEQRRNELLTQQRTALDDVTSAQQTLADAEANLATKQQDLNAAMAYATGVTSDLRLSQEDVVWSSEQASRLFDEMSQGLQGLQSEANATASSLGVLDESMGSLNLQQSKLRLEQMKLRDDFAEGRISNKAFKTASKELEDQMRNLAIEQQEVRIAMDETRASLEDQQKAAEDAQTKLDVLASANEGVTEAMDDRGEASDELTDKQDSLIETQDALRASLSKVIEKQNEEAESHLTSSRAVKAEERALWSLLAAKDAQEAVKRKIAQEQALERMGVAPTYVGGLQHGGIVTKPTLAMIGEAGPEAVIPLTAGGGGLGGGVSTIIIEKLFDADTVILDPENLDPVVDKILDGITDLLHSRNISTRRR